ncbi:KH domain-containing protein [Biomaibacter acetigenes]|jgi:spoIIIJ-associated protein|uniref:RNA-binding protein KhpB n=1 Tax=Biomaibacter acetigenes TaxID=2316383 RepID=A0A3G2R9H0_9FIRM|nr:RNA-binding cell elongation regulator Jag/EloR [Biomaibacter acetigenes]AYO32130.1 KH domain-containing protein [Biomaibacter acetigenes]MDN5301894.1 spoIIIJ-associated protein [Thermoanaerobacteraceae bacterium]RKL64520.1 protein jag [Thermoanaerobacteraceae bacterium SP2]
MKSVEKQAKTVDEAIELALKELNIKKEKAKIEVLEEGNRGILGFLSKAARVRVTQKDNPGERAVEFLKGLVKHFKIDPKIEMHEEDKDTIKITFEGKNVGALIGKHGSTLDAIQYLTSLVANRGNENYKRIILDAEDYRKKREEALERLAKNMARRVKETKKSVILEPMLPNERRIIHTALQGDSMVNTRSIGEEPNRRVVISLK